MSRPFMLAALLVLASGCMMGPKYSKPDIAAPAQYRGAVNPAPGVAASSLQDLEWFQQYSGQSLRNLLSRALENNYDLRLASERILEARARLGIERSRRFPTVEAAADFSNDEASASGAALPPGARREQSSGGVSLSLGWEIDMWGRLRRLSQAARAELLAQEWVQREVQTALIGDVARAYFRLLELDLQLEISKRTLSTRRESLRLTQVRKDQGVATALDVRQAENLVFAASARIPQVERLIEQQENLLSFLAGGNPGPVVRNTSLTQQRLAEVPAGLPGHLLERRPDIRAGEQRLIASNALIGAARAALFPNFSLTGLFGFRTLELDEFLDGDSRLRSASAGLLAPIFNAGRLRSRVRLSESQQRQALIEYERTIRNAFREVSNALVAVRKTREERIEQEHLVGALREANRLSKLRYQGGVDSYLQVLDADRDLFAGELNLAAIRRDELLSIVDLYQALGGGWQ